MSDLKGGPRGTTFPEESCSERVAPDSAIVFPELGFVAKCCDECSQRGRRLPPTGVIEIVARKGRAPLLQNTLEPPGLNISRHLIIVDVRDPMARQGCVPDEISVVKHERTIDPNLEGAPLVLEVPGVEPA
jgi:hypothetical protein